MFAALAALAAALALTSSSAEEIGANVTPGERASAATRSLVGAPYLSSRPDAGGPHLRLDAFDCLTFVETAVALGTAARPADAARALDDVRYASAPHTPATRNHEVLSQWIPANVAKGWIAEVTEELAGPLAREAAKTYSRASWEAVRSAGRGIRGLPRDRLPLGRFSVRLVAPDDVARVAPRIPDGTVVFVLRADRQDRATRVTHAGLAVRSERGELLVRHATSSKGVGRVVEEPIDRFLRRQARARPAWPLDGLTFFAIRANASRLQALPPPGAPAIAPAGERAPAVRAAPL